MFLTKHVIPNLCGSFDYLDCQKWLLHDRFLCLSVKFVFDNANNPNCHNKSKQFVMATKFFLYVLDTSNTLVW